MNYDLYTNNLPYPNKTVTNTIFFYQGGEVVGKADTAKEVSELKARFPKALTEKVKNEENHKKYREQLEEYHREEARLHALFRKDVFEEAALDDNEFTSKLFAIAWEKGHSSGLYSVESYFYELIELDAIARSVYGKK